MVFLSHFFVSLGCIACRGDAGAQTTIAANMAILFMLGILVLVLGSFLSFIFYLAKRSRNLVTAEAVDHAVPRDSRKQSSKN